MLGQRELHVSTKPPTGAALREVERGRQSPGVSEQHGVRPRRGLHRPIRNFLQRHKALHPPSIRVRKRHLPVLKLPAAVLVSRQAGRPGAGDGGACGAPLRQRWVEIVFCPFGADRGCHDDLGCPWI